MDRFAIDGSTDFSLAQAQVQALADATPEQKSRLSTTISVKTAPGPSKDGDKEGRDGKGEKVKKGGKERRRESEGGDGKRKKVKM
jgi:hypothetical protein